MVPVPVVAILPEVEILLIEIMAPSSVIRNVSDPFDWMINALFAAAFVSLIMTPAPVPVLVKLSPVALPLLTRLNDVGVVNPPVKLKNIPRPSDVSIVFPASYACCNVTSAALAGHCTNWLVTSSRQIVVAEFTVVLSTES